MQNFTASAAQSLRQFGDTASQRWDSVATVRAKPGHMQHNAVKFFTCHLQQPRIIDQLALKGQPFLRNS